MALRYWIGDGGNWWDAAHWSTTSGGSGGASVPSYADDVIFDNNSFSSPGETVYLVNGTNSSVVIQFKSLNTSGVSSAWSLDPGDYPGGDVSAHLYTYGDVTLNSYLYVADRYVTWHIQDNCTFTQGGADFEPTQQRSSIQIFGISVTLTLGGDLDANALSILAGSFDSAGYTVGLRNFDTYTSNAKSIDLSNSNVVFNPGVSNTNIINFEGTNTTWTQTNTVYIIDLDTTSRGIFANGVTLPALQIYKGTGTITLYGNNTYDSLYIEDGATVKFEAGKTHTIETYSIDGTSSAKTKLRSSSNGSTYTLRTYSGTVAVDYLDIKDSIATGGATFNATNSLDSGNNSGWNFIGPQPPVANFTADDTTPYNSQVVNFTDTSTNTPTSWSWDFGDSSTSTSQNPTHTYSSNGTYTVSLTATNVAGSDTETKTSYIVVTTNTTTLTPVETVSAEGSYTANELAVYNSESDIHATGSVVLINNYQPIIQKDYEYRVFDGSTYLGVLLNVTSDFEYSQNINENASELNITVARSPENRSVSLEILKDTASSNILDTNSQIIYVPTETTNSVGADTDVDVNLNLEVWTFYGGFEQLLDMSGDPILDTDNDPILVPFGNPNGKLVYQGYMADFELVYGKQTGVNVVIAPHATDMSHYVFKDSGDTTVAYLNEDPVQMAIDAMDDYISQGGYITYDSSSMPLSGESSDYTFNLQTPREVVDKTVELLPSGYYHFVDPGEAKQYLLNKSITAHHTFYNELHLTELKLRKSITQLKNKVYFIGGDTGSGDLFKYYEDTVSQANYRPGLERLADSRVTTATGASALSQQVLDTFAEPRYRTSVTISDAVYDIETIKLGQMVGFKNFGNFVDNLLLQIVSVQKRKHTITLDLDMVVPNDTKRLIELKKQLLSQEVANIGSAPS